MPSPDACASGQTGRSHAGVAPPQSVLGPWPLGTRCLVAATVATARTRRPASSRARCASRAVEPVVSTSSQTTSATGAAARERLARPRAHRHRAGEVGGATPLPRPAWSCTAQPLREHPCTQTPCLGRGRGPRRGPSAHGSWPRARTTARREGTGTSTAGRSTADGPRTGAARTRPSGGRGKWRLLLVRQDHRAEQVGVLSRREAGGQPGGQGWAAPTARPAAGGTPRQSTRPGAQPTHAARGRGRATRRARRSLPAVARAQAGRPRDRRWATGGRPRRPGGHGRRSRRRSSSWVRGQLAVGSACRAAGPA